MLASIYYITSMLYKDACCIENFCGKNIKIYFSFKISIFFKWQAGPNYSVILIDFILENWNCI